MRLPQLILVVVTAVSAGACSGVHARVEPELPVLEPPPPPPRIVETYVDEPVPTVEPSPAETAMTTPPVKPPARPPAARTTPPPPPEPARTEPERAPSPPTVALTLKPAPGVETKTEASIRELLGRAARDLNRVNYSALNADGRAQYDTARRFMQQSEDALRGGNLVFAGKLADKAATMAAVLVR